MSNAFFTIQDGSDEKISVLSDLPQRVLDLAFPDMHRVIRKSIASVSRWRVKCVRVDIFRSKGTEVIVEAFPSNEDLIFVLTPIRYTSHVCPECTAAYEVAWEHPDNGCKLGEIERVLER